MSEFWNDNLILKVVAGSKAYGLATTDSDTDKYGICIEPLDCLIGLNAFEQKENHVHALLKKDEIHETIYGLRKFVRLAMQCNPNIIEILFTPEKNILDINQYGKLLRSKRDLFLSRQARNRFVGYAISQLERIKRHKRWLDNPPSKPSQKDFVRNTSIQTHDGNRIQFRKFFENEYDKVLKEYNSYCEWRNNRNSERAELERKFGYDCKHAAHLVRLFEMGCEILRGEGVKVFREDRERLLNVRNGLYSYDEILVLTKSYEEELDKLEVTSPLPIAPNYNAINQLLMDIYKHFYHQDFKQLPNIELE